MSSPRLGSLFLSNSRIHSIDSHVLNQLSRQFSSRLTSKTRALVSSRYSALSNLSLNSVSDLSLSFGLCTLIVSHAFSDFGPSYFPAGFHQLISRVTSHRCVLVDSRAVSKRSFNFRDLTSTVALVWSLTSMRCPRVCNSPQLSFRLNPKFSWALLCSQRVHTLSFALRLPYALINFRGF